MTKAEVLSTMRSAGIVPVLRAESEDQAMRLAEAVFAGGITVMEVTMTVPGAIRVIAALIKEFPELLIGAGTVLDPENAQRCIEEGAQFVVSPIMDPKTVAMCQRYDVAALPGALTPTEVVLAWQSGADVVKIFPASAMGGAKYLRSLKAPLPQIEMIPTGGVSVATAHEFLAAGAFALGVGADLVDTKAIDEGRGAAITENARRYVEAVRLFRAR